MIGFGLCAFAQRGGFARAEAICESSFICDPLPTPQCHASSIAETPAGLVVAWFGGTQEQNPDVGIWVARRLGNKWLAPTEVVMSYSSCKSG